MKDDRQLLGRENRSRIFQLPDNSLLHVDRFAVTDDPHAEGRDVVPNVIGPEVRRLPAPALHINTQPLYRWVALGLPPLGLTIAARLDQRLTQLFELRLLWMQRSQISIWLHVDPRPPHTRIGVRE